MKYRGVRQLSDLSPSRRRLVNNIRRIYFGHIDCLRVRNGDTVWDPPPDIYSGYKYDGTDRPLAIHEQETGELKKHFVNLFTEFDERQNFTITRLMIQDGLPLRREVKETPV